MDNRKSFLAYGRRTGINILEGKNIRKHQGGGDVFEDYWSDSEETTSTSSHSSKVSKKSSPNINARSSRNTPSSPFKRLKKGHSSDNLAYGRRSRINILEGKNIRKLQDGRHNFEDYWTDSELTASVTSVIPKGSRNSSFNTDIQDPGKNINSPTVKKQKKGKDHSFNSSTSEIDINHGEYFSSNKSTDISKTLKENKDYSNFQRYTRSTQSNYNIDISNTVSEEPLNESESENRERQQQDKSVKIGKINKSHTNKKNQTSSIKSLKSKVLPKSSTPTKPGTSSDLQKNATRKYATRKSKGKNALNITETSEFSVDDSLKSDKPVSPVSGIYNKKNSPASNKLKLVGNLKFKKSALKLYDGIQSKAEKFGKRNSSPSYSAKDDNFPVNKSLKSLAARKKPRNTLEMEKILSNYDKYDAVIMQLMNESDRCANSKNSPERLSENSLIGANESPIKKINIIKKAQPETDKKIHFNQTMQISSNEAKGTNIDVVLSPAYSSAIKQNSAISNQIKLLSEVSEHMLDKFQKKQSRSREIDTNEIAVKNKSYRSSCVMESSESTSDNSQEKSISDEDMQLSISRESFSAKTHKSNSKKSLEKIADQHQINSPEEAEKVVESVHGEDQINQNNIMDINSSQISVQKENICDKNYSSGSLTDKPPKNLQSSKVKRKKVKHNSVNKNQIRRSNRQICSQEKSISDEDVQLSISRESFSAKTRKSNSKKSLEKIADQHQINGLEEAEKVVESVHREDQINQNNIMDINSSQISVQKENICDKNYSSGSLTDKPPKNLQSSKVKHKKVKHNSVDKNQIRRSNRQRFQRLECWRNERLLYCWEDGEYKLCGIDKGTADDAVHATDIKRKILKKKETVKKIKMIDTVKNKTMKVFMLKDFSSIPWLENCKDSEDVSYRIKKLFQTSNSGFGYVEIDKCKQKPSQYMPEEDLQMTLIRGEVEVVVQKSSFKPYVKDMFIIPRGTAYSIKNIGNSKALLVYSVGKFKFLESIDSGQTD